jgi:hypothetical protein
MVPPPHARALKSIRSATSSAVTAEDRLLSSIGNEGETLGAAAGRGSTARQEEREIKHHARATTTTAACNHRGTTKAPLTLVV